jgi:glycosyltransferase involved in cell wall biosynthesis
MVWNEYGGPTGHGGPFMPIIGYVPFGEAVRNREVEWLRDFLGVQVQVVTVVPTWNTSPPDRLPPVDRLVSALQPLLPLPAVVIEGPGGFLWAALLRAHGYAGAVTLLPGLNPRGWRDVLSTAVYRRFSDRRDRVFVGSRPSAALFSALGLEPDVGDAYGVDDRLFRIRPEAERVRDEFDLPPGRLLLYAGRVQHDKDLYSFLQVGLKARLLFPDLVVVVASHEVDDEYLTPVLKNLDDTAGVYFALDPTPRQLADLYNIADVFLTASTSRFETFGRAPAEALICGCPCVAPRYDGFVEILAQPGGSLVDPKIDGGDGTPRADEFGLLRAVYDVLTATRRPTREEIADVARRRFARSQTMGLLRNLVDGSTRRPGSVVAPARLELPAPWREELARQAARSPEEALAACWSQAEHDRLAEHDGEFGIQVRRALCVPPLRQELVPCR